MIKKKEIKLEYNPKIEEPLLEIGRNMKGSDKDNIVALMFKHWLTTILYEYDQKVAEKKARDNVKPRTDIF